MSFLNRVVDGGAGVGAVGRALDGALTQLPALLEYLTADRYPDGTARTRATFTVFVEDGCVKVCLSDRDQGRTLWRSAQGLEIAMLEVEDALTTGLADWRRAAPRTAAGKVNGKKP